MKVVPAARIADVVSELCQRASFDLSPDVRSALQEALRPVASLSAQSRSRPRGSGRSSRCERHEPAREVLRLILENAALASREKIPICQDTGLAVVLIEKGEDVRIDGGPLTGAVTAGIRRGYQAGYLRKSVFRSPLDRVNTGDNTPPIIHIDEVPGERLIISLMAKGGGCENASALRMLNPADGEEGIVAFVLETVRRAGAAACPPFIIGVGIGGTMDVAAWLAKKALFREIGSAAPGEQERRLEERLLREVNSTGIGPAGLGGDTTALAVHVLTHPCHIASLPVAVNIDCHAHRIARAEL